MNRYEAEYKNMRACYIKTYLQNVLLMILAIFAIWLTDSLWGIISLIFMSNCSHNNFGKKVKEDD